MNIAFVVPEFVTETKGGGLATYINNISRILAKREHIITIIVLSTVEESVLYEENIFLERVCVDISNVPMNVPGSIVREYSRVLNLKLLHIDKNIRKIDVVQYANWKALAYYRTNLPTVVRISSYWPYWRAASSLDYCVGTEYDCIKTIDYLEELALMNADYVFGPSVLFANIISQRTGVSIDVIESPYVEKLIKEDPSLYNTKLRGKKYILTFGNLNLIKGIKLLGDSIYKILEDNPNIYYVLAGTDGGWKDANGLQISAVEYMRENALEYAERIIYVGALNREKLYPIIENAYCCVFPSRVDNLPNACIEAMAKEKLVIGTEGASFEQLICDGQNGFLIERENADSLCKILNRVLRLKYNERKKIEQLAKKRIDDIDTDGNVVLLERIYQKVADGYKQKFDLKYYNDIHTKYISEIGFEDDEKMLME